MGLFKGTQEQYHGLNSFTVTGSPTNTFTLDFPTLPTSSSLFNVYITGTVNGVTSTSRALIAVHSVAITSYTASTGVLVLNTNIPVGVSVEVIITNPNLGNYQYIKLEDLVNNFIVGYTGEDKIINRAKRTDVVFHAKRGIQEFSYDTFRSTKSQELEVPPTLVMELPPDYVNYVKIMWVDNAGVFRPLVPTKHTGNPTELSQDEDYEYIFNNDGTYLSNPKSTTLTRREANDDYLRNNNDPEYDTDIHDINEGRRYGMDTSLASINGDYFIDYNTGKIHFSSNLTNKVVVLQYISDGLGTDAEMIVHKFAEEAIYKHIAHAILATKINIPEFLVARYKKERRAAIRTAKLRLSNLKAEELTSVMRGKSKQIKH
tara:strand:- start:5658 stop:6779 length:1122 start_codon:yes stop_codon:yes gene_type:complete